MSNRQNQSLQGQAPKEEEQNHQLAIIQQSYSGPLPPSSELEKYNKVLPGLADRITKMAENQSCHRQKMERSLLFLDGFKHLSGQLFAFLIVLCGIAVGGYLALNDKPVEAFFAGFIPLAAIVGAFLYDKSKKKESGE